MGISMVAQQLSFVDIELLTATYVLRTSCHGRRIYVDERELVGDRSVTVACPACGAVGVLCIAGPLATWTK